MWWINDVFMNFILCVLVLPRAKSLDDEEYVYLLATALYMADDQGKYVLLDKALPPSLEAIIREHALSLLNPSERSKTKIKVVPRPPHLQPFNSNPNILRVDLREMTSRKHFVGEMWDGFKNFWDHKIMRKGSDTKKNINLVKKISAPNLDNVTDSTGWTQTNIMDTADENSARITDASDEVGTSVIPYTPAIKVVQWVNTIKDPKDEEGWLENPEPTGTSDVELLEKYQLTKQNKDELEKDQLTKPNKDELEKDQLTNKDIGEDKPTKQNDYVPSDLYYSIEKKCVNWSDCPLKMSSILKQPASFYKYYSKLLTQPK